MEDRTAQDREVVRRVLGGDGEAFAGLVARYQKLVAGVAWRYGVRSEEIEDVVSEVFLKAYGNLASYRPVHPFSTWLYRLAANHVVDHGRRRRKRGREVELTERLDAPGPGPDELLERRERASIVRAALAGLRPRYREVLFCVYIEGMRIEEAARTLGLPQGTIKSRLLRGRRALQRALSRSHPGTFGE